jgi:hypothetical protein
MIVVSWKHHVLHLQHARMIAAAKAAVFFIGPFLWDRKEIWIMLLKHLRKKSYWQCLSASNLRRIQNTVKI